MSRTKNNNLSKFKNIKVAGYKIQKIIYQNSKFNIFASIISDCLFQ